jgi:uncharacterized membrane protein YccF (DUF307 family)
MLALGPLRACWAAPPLPRPRGLHRHIHPWWVMSGRLGRLRLAACRSATRTRADSLCFKVIMFSSVGQGDIIRTGQPGGGAMRIILNLIWLVLCGIWMAIAYAVAGLLCFLLFFLVVTIPFGIAAFRIANYVLWPFGRDIAPRQGGMGVGALIGNIIWVILFGWELAIGHLVAGILLCLTIIGIPLGLASFKIIPISLIPLGVRIVPAREPSPNDR